MSALAVSSVWVVVIALTTSSMPKIHRPTEREPFCGCREVGFDQLRAAGGVDEPGAVRAAHLVQRRLAPHAQALLQLRSTASEERRIRDLGGIKCVQQGLQARRSPRSR